MSRVITAGAWGSSAVWLIFACYLGEGRLLIPAIGCAVVAIVLDLTADRNAARAQVWDAAASATREAWAEYRGLSESAKTATGAHLAQIRARQAYLLRILGHREIADLIDRDTKGRDHQ